MWHEVAPRLAEHFTVVATDLRGFGDSTSPPAAPDHAPNSMRAIGREQVEAMSLLGFDRFAVVGHDRGARCAYRMAIDHPQVITQLAVLDIVPTGEIWARADATFALGYWHWPFLAQDAPLPERLILGDPDGFWIAVERQGQKTDARYPPEVVAAYRTQMADPAHVTAMCEDYRAGATIDRALDDADRGARTIACPTRALWGADGALPRLYADPLDLWRRFAPGVTGSAIRKATHFLVEDQPEAVVADLLAFFR
jgi:haloacetate dehalogenase